MCSATALKRHFVVGQPGKRIANSASATSGDLRMELGTVRLIYLGEV